MSEFIDKYSTLLSGLAGLIIGALVIYLGVENLTAKMMDASTQVGAVQERAKYTLESLDKSRETVAKSLIEINELEKKAKDVGDRLKKVEDSTASEISDQLKIISNFSDDQKELVKVGDELVSIRKSLNGKTIYTCPAHMPSGCDAAQHCQSMCVGQLQIDKDTCTHRIPGGKPVEKKCKPVGRLVGM